MAVLHISIRRRGVAVLQVRAWNRIVIYILAAGHAVLACGEIAQQGFSLKQEPAEAIQVFA